jgi:hypothetical protein
MSARAFFDIRYSLPGYTFILLTVLINLRADTLKSILLRISPPTIPSNDAITFFGILFGFLTLLSGASLGFLVAQFWHALFNYVLRGHYRIERYFDLRARPYEKLETLGIINDRITLTTVLDYILSSKRKDEIHLYVVRRWDLLHTIGSTGIAVILGSAIGYTIKYFVLTPTPLDRWDFLVLVFSAVLLICLGCGFYKISEESLLMATFIVDQWDEKKKLRKHVPKQYFGSEPQPETSDKKT